MFLIWPHLEHFFQLFQPFGAFLGLLGLFFWFESVPKAFRRLSILVSQEQSYPFVLNLGHFFLFCNFWALWGNFWGWGQAQNFYFGSIALSFFFKTFPEGGFRWYWSKEKSTSTEEIKLCGSYSSYLSVHQFV